MAGGDASRWIVQGAPVASGALAKVLSGDPAVRLLARAAPDVVVLDMTADRAQRLRDEVQGLTIEKDAELGR